MKATKAGRGAPKDADVSAMLAYLRALRANESRLLEAGVLMNGHGGQSGVEANGRASVEYRFGTAATSAGGARSLVLAHLELMRPANLLTAAADILAGYAAAGAPAGPRLALLITASVGLYAAGVVWNDIFDRKLDAAERPERPIPSGRAPVRSAAVLGGALMLAGILAAFLAGPASAVLAVLISAAALFYDRYGKHTRAGPLNMGLCRGLNLLLGMSAAPAVLAERWPLAFVPFMYIAAITAVSQGEVHGGSRRAIAAALISVAATPAALAALSLAIPFRFAAAAPFLAILLWSAGVPLVRAWRAPSPANIRKSIRSGVLGLILLDAAVVSGYAGIIGGATVSALLPASVLVARRFQVT